MLDVTLTTHQVPVECSRLQGTQARLMTVWNYVMSQGLPLLLTIPSVSCPCPTLFQ